MTPSAPAPRLPDDHELLTRAVLANPGEDTPKLALADWLEEHGDPERAAEIRVERVDPRHLRSDTRVRRRWTRVARRLTGGLVPRDWPVLVCPLPGDDPPGVPAGEDAGAWEYTRGAPGAADRVHLVAFRHGHVVCLGASLVHLWTRLPLLIRRQPIERVAVTDLRLPRVAGGWAVAADAPCLPRMAYDRLTPPERLGVVVGRTPPGPATRYAPCRVYPTETMARVDLSRALLSGAADWWGL